MFGRESSLREPVGPRETAEGQSNRQIARNTIVSKNDSLCRIEQGPAMIECNGSGQTYRHDFARRTTMNDPNLSSFIWSVAISCEATTSNRICKVILPFTVLRRLDCVLENQGPC